MEPQLLWGLPRPRLACPSPTLALQPHPSSFAGGRQREGKAVLLGRFGARRLQFMAN